MTYEFEQGVRSVDQGNRRRIEPYDDSFRGKRKQIAKRVVIKTQRPRRDCVALSWERLSSSRMLDLLVWSSTVNNTREERQVRTLNGARAFPRSPPPTSFIKMCVRRSRAMGNRTVEHCGCSRHLSVWAVSTLAPATDGVGRSVPGVKPYRCTRCLQYRAHW